MTTPSDIGVVCPACGSDFQVEARLMRHRPNVDPLCWQCWSQVPPPEPGEPDDQARQMLETRRARAGIPRELARVSFTDLSIEPDRIDAIEDAERWAAGEIKGVLLAGPVGTGKTWIAAAAANARLEHGGLRWESTPLLLTKAVAADENAKREALKSLEARSGALVLDDIDKVGSSEWAKSTVFQAVDNAVQQGRPLIVTTNCNASQLSAKLGRPTVSRLVGYCRRHRIEGTDRRLQ